VNDAAWTLYMLRSERGALYTGITTDPERRLAEHRGAGRRGARYTRACRSLELVYSCLIGTRSLALRAEARVKRLAKPAKEQLVMRQPRRGELLQLLRLGDA